VPPARRAGRPGWRDPRLLLGIVIVAASVVAGSVLLGSGEDATAVWAVRKDLPAGARLTADVLQTRPVHFADPGDLAGYLTGATPAGRVLSRPVGAGELVPRGAVDGAVRHLLEVPLRVDPGDVPATVREGSRVDVWVAPREATADERPRARRVLTDVPVVRLPPSSTSLAPETTRQVIVAVPPGTPLEEALGATSAGRVVLTHRS
jgi:hypothetical protein